MHTYNYLYVHYYVFCLLFFSFFVFVNNMIIFNKIKSETKPVGLEDKDDAFFTKALEMKSFTSELLETKEMRYMWDENKSITQFLYMLKKPSSSPREATTQVTLAATSTVSTQAESPLSSVSSSSLSLLDKLQGLQSGLQSEDSNNRNQVNDQECSHHLEEEEEEYPNDSESLTKYMKMKAEEISKEEDIARNQPLILPRDALGYVLPITIPGPLAPKHEDHPAYGMKIWPPRRPTTTLNGDGNGKGAAASSENVPSWVNGDEDVNPFPDWMKK